MTRAVDHLLLWVATLMLPVRMFRHRERMNAHVRRLPMSGDDDRASLRVHAPLPPGPIAKTMIVSFVAVVLVASAIDAVWSAGTRLFRALAG